jgi:hypothetical protein
VLVKYSIHESKRITLELSIADFWLEHIRTKFSDDDVCLTLTFLRSDSVRLFLAASARRFSSNVTGANPREKRDSKATLEACSESISPIVGRLLSWKRRERISQSGTMCTRAQSRKLAACGSQSECSLVAFMR